MNNKQEEKEKRKKRKEVAKFVGLREYTIRVMDDADVRDTIQRRSKERETAPERRKRYQRAFGCCCCCSKEERDRDREKSA
jgi:hypothetical protein